MKEAVSCLLLDYSSEFTLISVDEDVIIAFICKMTELSSHVGIGTTKTSRWPISMILYGTSMSGTSAGLRGMTYQTATTDGKWWMALHRKTAKGLCNVDLRLSDLSKRAKCTFPMTLSSLLLR